MDTAHSLHFDVAGLDRELNLCSIVATRDSHKGKGWEEFTDAAIRELANRRENIVFILWGSYAQKKGAFIDRMDYAYAAADVAISRSGACTVSELCLVAKPTVFVPSPNVSEDHQTKNAMALVEKGAAAIVPDSEAVQRGMAVALELVADRERLAQLRENIAKMAISDAAERVVREIESELIKAQK